MMIVAEVDRVGARLFVAWQDPESHAYHPVAVLQEDGDHGSYSMRYLKRAESIEGFTPFVAFPELHAEYVSDELFSFFTNRVMSPRRPDYPQFLETLGLPSHARPVEILARLGARATDSIEVFPEPEVDPTNGRLRTRFFVRGLRHVHEAELAVADLHDGDLVRLVPEPDNPYNPRAVQVATAAGSIIGWVPDYLVDPLRRAVGNDLGRPTVVVERVNPASSPRQTRVLCRLEVDVPVGFVPFDGSDFVEIDVAPRVTAAG